MPDGYVITPSGADALMAWGKPGVRHCATLDNGQGFVAFDGDVPAAGALLENVETMDFFWLVPKIRHLAPLPESVDHFGLYTSEGFRSLLANRIIMASLLTDDTILAITTAPQDAAFWSATTVSFLDVRVPQPVGV